VRPSSDLLLRDIRGLIEQARQQVARTVNSAMVGLYWGIGKRVREDVLHEKRAGYGEEIVSALSAQLTAENGRGYGRRNLFRMVRFAEVFPDERIVSSLMTQLSWPHLPIGIILCAGKKEETVRLLDLDKRGIQVSSYWTEVLPKEELERKLHEAVVLARERLARQGQEQPTPPLLPAPRKRSGKRSKDTRD
jgi:hypothetical protein